MRRLLPLCFVLLCAAPTPRARAYEDQLTLGLGAGYAHAADDALPRNGVLFDLTLSAGLLPEWAVRGRASYALHPADAGLHVGSLGGELLYLVDVLSVVPYFGPGAGGLLRVHDDDSQLAAEVHFVLGVDWLLSRELALELDARSYFIPADFGESTPLYFALAAGVVFFFDD